MINNITYDTKKAETVENGYLPDVDETLETQKGICFDYAALMTSMLRSQGIPTKLQIGYAGKVYHAWISVYLEETGWIAALPHWKSWQHWQVIRLRQNPLYVLRQNCEVNYAAKMEPEF